MTEVATKVAKEKKAPVPISVSGVLADLDAGLDREKIKAKYGISHSDMALLFKDPSLKGRKPKGAVRAKKAPGFVLIQDLGVEDTSNVADTTTADVAGAAITEDAVASTAPAETAQAGETLDKW